MQNKILDTFGKQLMRNVRDESIDEWRLVFSGKFRDKKSEATRESLRSLNAEQKKAVEALTTDIVDSVLFNLLVMLQDSDDLNVAVNTRGQHSDDLREVSDGLPGELYTSRGWIAKFSKKPPGRVAAE